MTGEKVDRIIAERIMGWKYEQQRGSIEGARDQEGEYHPWSEDMRMFGNYWSPSTNLAHAAEAEARLSGEQRREYLEELGCEVAARSFPDHHADLWAWTTATPAQRAKALAAVAGEGEPAPARPA